MVIFDIGKLPNYGILTDWRWEDFKYTCNDNLKMDLYVYYVNVMQLTKKPGPVYILF